MTDSNEFASEIRQAYLDAVFANAVDAIVVIDERGIICDVNPATSVVFGYSTDELVSHNVSMLMPNPYREEHDGYLESYRQTGVRKIIGIGREVVGQRKDGSTFPMHLAVSEIQLAGQRLFVGVVRDITDLKTAENQLRQLNDQLEQLVQERTEELRAAQAELIRKEKLATLGQVSGGIAHEIRNPLNVVKTSVYYLVHAKNPTEEKIGEHLERIDRQVTMIDHVVTALSDVARLPDPKPANCDIRELITNVVKSTSLPPDIRVDIQLDDALPEIRTDVHQMPIVFRNLIRNARDAMPGGGCITITTQQNLSELLIRVTDEGTGIDPEHLALIMEPLYSTKARGMGLGLAISNTIVLKNRGRLTVESEPGVGTTFTVSLPIGRSTDAEVGTPA